MSFYKFTLKKAEKDELTEETVLEACESFNQELAPEAGAFLACYQGRRFRGRLETRVFGGLCFLSPGNPEDMFFRFFQQAGLKEEAVDLEEITFEAWIGLLRSAVQNDYIENHHEVLETFRLDHLDEVFHSHPAFRSFPCGETIFNQPPGREAIGQRLEKLCAAETIRMELERIYAGSARTCVLGHPVHYLLETGTEEKGSLILETLLQALYENGRILSRRYCTLEIGAQKEFPESAAQELWQSCQGGAVVVRCSEQTLGEEGNFSESLSGALKSLGTIARKNRNQVLTVFCLPEACEGLKRDIREQLGALPLVELREDEADPGQARSYLKRLCDKRRIRPDKKLYDWLEEGERYPAAELEKQFENWFDAKIREKVYPQYRELSVPQVLTKEVASGKAYRELQALIGLGEVKAILRKALNYYRLQKLCQNRGVSQNRPAMHMVFTGNPGTAKTTTARLFARIMKEEGVLSSGHLVEVGRADLVGRFVGWTAPTVKQKFQKAQGGVLFIDEAYSLVEERTGLYGDEAINTIVQEMENLRDDLIVIFAGYPEPMERFLNKNPGLRSRIAFHVPFADYDVEELCGIARLLAEEEGLRFTEGAMEKLARVFEAARRQPDFGNGRYVRNLLEEARMNQADRLLSRDVTEITDEELLCLEEADIRDVPSKPQEGKRVIGFAPCA